MYSPVIGYHADGKAISKAQGQIGSKVEINGVVIAQHSIPVSTPSGTVYSNVHLLEDHQGNVYKYKGSSIFQKGHHVRLVATVKNHFYSNDIQGIITVVKAPKLIR